MSNLSTIRSVLNSFSSCEGSGCGGAAKIGECEKALKALAEVELVLARASSFLERAIRWDFRGGLSEALAVLEELHQCLSAPPVQSGQRVPDGTPGVRDVDNPCEFFAYGPPTGSCSTDGHYLCKECVHRSTEEEKESRGAD